VTTGTVNYLAPGTCTLVAHVATGTNYSSADGSAQSYDVGYPAPKLVSLTVRPHRITVVWSAPDQVHGSILGYTATATANGQSVGTCSTKGSSVTSCTISGLTDLVTYSVTVTASEGGHHLSTVLSASSSALTATPCQALTGLSFGRGVRSIRGSWGISWTPASADGATVTYTVTLTDGGGALVATTATTSTSVTLNGLTHGAYYVAVVTANTPASVAGIISPLVISRGNTAT
jgi:hypothetical protein